VPERYLRGPARWSLRKRLALLLTAAGLLLAATLVTQVVLQQQQRSVRDELLTNLDPAVVATADLRGAVIDLETSVRGYSVTDDPRFLESYAAAEEGGDASLDELASLVVDDRGLSAQVEDVRALVEGWQERIARPVIEASTEAERAAVRTVEFEQEGLRRVEAMRTSIDRIENELLAVRADKVGDLNGAARRSTWAMLLQAAGVVLAGLLLLVALTRVVIRPIDHLGRDARKVAGGDLRHVVRGQGSPDLARLGGHVDAMRTRILAEVEQLSEATADLERQTEELARSNSDLEQFAYVASHDLQEPLRKVSSFCQLLQKRYSDQLDDRANEYINFAVDGAKRMQDLINDLLAFSRVGRTTESFEPVDLGEIVDDVVGVLDPAIASAGATVTVGELPVIMGDRRLLGATFQNLVANALKFRGEAPPTVDISAVRCDGADGPEWVVTVADNGIGIDPAYGDQIFVIFKRLHGKAEYAGTGIGLALVKKIVEFHGGRVWLESHSPPGSTFKLALPAGTPTERSTSDAG
jgi:signal transduction histidine kinase